MDIKISIIGARTWEVLKSDLVLFERNVKYVLFFFICNYPKSFIHLDKNLNPWISNE